MRARSWRHVNAQMLHSSRNRTAGVSPTDRMGLENKRRIPMSQIIYIVGAIVIVLALLSFVGLR